MQLAILMFYKIVHKLAELPLPDNIYYSFRSTRGNEHKFIPPGGEVSVAPTRHWVTCSSKPAWGCMEGFFSSFLGPFQFHVICP